MYSILNLQIISTICPNGMDKNNCPVQQYIGQQNTFRTTANESLLEPVKPYLDVREEYIATLDKIHELCAKCQGKSK